jgi:SAM-dependent methyltransferase
MVEQLYAEYPALYDAIQSEWDYDRDISFVCDQLTEQIPSETQLLEVGCGTGEHTRRFVDAGFDVTAVDPVKGMLSLAREKTTAEFRQCGLPDLDVKGAFDVIVAIRGVINHLPPENLAPALEALDAYLADGGVLVFDNSPLSPDGNHPALDIGTADQGQYARIVQMNPTDDERLSWDSVVFTPDGEFFIDSYEMTPFDDLTIGAALAELGLSVEPVDGYVPNDRRTVFVARA